MANPNAVGSFTLDNFGNARVAIAVAQLLNVTGNGTVTSVEMPLLSGGLTNGGAVSNSGSVIIRRIVANNPSGNVSLANISITTSSDGNISNAVVANVVLSNLTTAGRYQDLAIAAPYSANTAVSGSTTSALFVNVVTASGNTNTVNFAVYGDVVSF
jgi:hypothetical protein